MIGQVDHLAMYKGNIVITGVSSGIGLACLKKFISEGYRVFGSVRKPSDAQSISAELGEAFQPLHFDVTNEKAVQRAAFQVSNILDGQGIELLINNAGVAVSGPVTQVEIDDFRFQFEVNVFGLISVTKAFLSLLGASKSRSHKPGKIFNISSVSGELAFPFMSPYVASKHAVEGFSKALRMELLLYGIDVIIIAPGSVQTSIWSKVEPLEEDVLQSDYGPILQKFKKEVMEGAQEAMPVDELAHHVFDVFIDNKPKTRYAFLKNRWKKWIIPRYLMPARMLDGFIKRMFFPQ